MKGDYLNLRSSHKSPVHSYHTPGHADGSISVVYREKAFVGDLMINRWFQTTYYSIYADGDTKLIKKQWIKLLKKGCTEFYPGHGGIIKGKDSRYFQHLAQGIYSAECIEKNKII
jgi:glyoxylase-like metal-dependent hydrolase (beta-lactamase superfamily II)